MTGLSSSMVLNVPIKMPYNVRLILDGLEHTRNWLLQHINTTEPVPKDVEYDKFIRTCSKKAFTAACIDLLDWDRSHVNWLLYYIQLNILSITGAKLIQRLLFWTKSDCLIYKLERFD